MDRMMRLFEQRVQQGAVPPKVPPAMAPSVAPVVPVAPAVPTTSGQASRLDGQLSLEKQRDLIDQLIRFRQFDPPRFSGRSLEP